MPNYDNNHKVGDLYITFDVQFPKKELSTEQKECMLILWMDCYVWVVVYDFLSLFQCWSKYLNRNLALKFTTACETHSEFNYRPQKIIILKKKVKYKENEC